MISNFSDVGEARQSDLVSQYLIPVTIIAFIASMIGSLIEMSMMTETATTTVSMARCTFNGEGKGNMMGTVTITQNGETATYKTFHCNLIGTII